jgi:sortase B
VQKGHGENMADLLQDILDEVESRKEKAAQKEAPPEPPEPKYARRKIPKNAAKNVAKKTEGDVVQVLPVYPDLSGEVIPFDSKLKAFFLSMYKAVVPQKGDCKLEIGRKIVFDVSLIVAIVCMFIILGGFLAGRKDAATYQEIRESVEQAAYLFELSGSVYLPAEAVEELIALDPEALRAYAQELYEAGIVNLPPERIYEIMIEKPGILPHFIETYDRNSDLIGWVKIPGTRLDYPVLQYRRYLENGTVTGNNHYYLDHNIDHVYVWNGHGSIYSDWHFPFTPTSRPDNIILYGHNMNDGSRFHPVVRYYTYYYANPGHLRHYTAHPFVEFSTLYEEATYKVFAAFFVHTEEHKYDDVYDYFRKRAFTDRAEFYDFMQNIMDRSSFFADVDIMYGDEIITLSTCHYPLGDTVDARVAMFARRLREGEAVDDFDIEAAWVNPSPLYFNLWYTRYGGSWGGRNWDTSKVIGLDEFLLENPEADTRLTCRTINR